MTPAVAGCTPAGKGYWLPPIIEALLLPPSEVSIWPSHMSKATQLAAGIHIPVEQLFISWMSPWKNLPSSMLPKVLSRSLLALAARTAVAAAVKQQQPARAQLPVLQSLCTAPGNSQQQVTRAFGSSASADSLKTSGAADADKASCSQLHPCMHASAACCALLGIPIS